MKLEFRQLQSVQGNVIAMMLWTMQPSCYVGKANWECYMVTTDYSLSRLIGELHNNVEKLT